MLPLCIDLDGTLILTDTTWLATRKYIRRNPLNLLTWILHGRAYYKHQLAKRVVLDPSTLPYRQSLLKYLQTEHQQGRPIYLVSATDHQFAQAVADYLGIFTDVFASDGHINLRARAKADYLIQKFGDKQFIYAGNSFDDLYVWKHSAEAIVCSNNTRLIAEVKKLNIPASLSTLIEMRDVKGAKIIPHKDAWK